jgi:hypothetical protein
MRATSHVHNRLLPGTPTPSSPTNISFYDSRKHASHRLHPQYVYVSSALWTEMYSEIFAAT